MSIFDPEQSLNLAAPPSADDAIFQSAENGWDNACLHYAPNGWLTYALGYKEAADRLVAELERERRRQDVLVYPIVYLYRHYLELAIKGLIRQAQKLLEDPIRVPAKHTIVQLWSTCSVLLGRVSPNDSLEEQDQIGRLLREFEAIDPTCTAFRYPVDTKGNQSLPGVRHIDVPNVRDVIGKIAVILDGASTQIDHYCDCMPDLY